MTQPVGTLADSVVAAIRHLEMKPQDRAAADLAVAYARLVDEEPAYLVKVGPPLLACLESLLMTPRARTAIVKGAGDDQRKRANPVDELRAKRNKRAG